MTTKTLPTLSPAETEILSLVWQLGRATVQTICNHLPSQRNITYATVQTLLRRLEKKGYIKHAMKGKAHIFSPAVQKEKVITKSVGEFLDRLFGGDPLPLMMHLTQHGKLNKNDIDQLKQWIDQNNH